MVDRGLISEFERSLTSLPNSAMLPAVFQPRFHHVSSQLMQMPVHLTNLWQVGWVRGTALKIQLSPRKGELRILARNAAPGISHLNLGRTSRLHTPRLEPIIPLSRPLPNPSFTHLGAADS